MVLAPLANNIWVTLTLLLPGFFTFGIWRLLLVLEPSSRLDTVALSQIDSSAIVCTSVIIAIALFQQIAGLLIESIGCLVTEHTSKHKRTRRRLLFCGRASLRDSGAKHDAVARVVAKFYQTLNISMGLLLLLAYFIYYDRLEFSHWIPISMVVAFVLSVVAVFYRMKCAYGALNSL